MGYTLEGVVAAADLLVRVTPDLPAARWAPLRQGFGVLPMTEELFDSQAGQGAAPPPGPDPDGFWSQPVGFDAVLGDWSRHGPIAYLEIDYAGGVGQQRAALWQDGGVVFGPVGVPVGPPPVDGPVSQVLRRLGVRRGRHVDEFEALGLRQRRHTDDWLA